MRHFLLRSVMPVSGPHGKNSAWQMGAAVLTAALLFAPPVLASNPGWYVTASAGQSHFTGVDSSGNPVFPDSFGNTDNGYRLSVGYQFNSYFGLEAGYVDLGKVTGSAFFATPLIVCLPPTVCPPEPQFVSADLKTHGWIFELVGLFPFGQRWTVFGRLGGIQADSELNMYEQFAPSNNGAFTVNSTSKDLDVTYGLGLQWLFAGNWAARLSWDRYMGLGDKLPMDTFGVNFASIGIVYQF